MNLKQRWRWPGLDRSLVDHVIGQAGHTSVHRQGRKGVHHREDGRVESIGGSWRGECALGCHHDLEAVFGVVLRSRGLQLGHLSFPHLSTHLHEGGPSLRCQIGISIGHLYSSIYTNLIGEYFIYRMADCLLYPICAFGFLLFFRVLLAM